MYNKIIIFNTTNDNDNTQKKQNFKIIITYQRDWQTNQHVHHVILSNILMRIEVNLDTIFSSINKEKKMNQKKILKLCLLVIENQDCISNIINVDQNSILVIKKYT